MINSILFYICVGMVVAIINNHLMALLQTKDEMFSENPSIILALLFSIILWPIMLITTIRLICLYFIRKRNEKNNQ